MNIVYIIEDYSENGGVEKIVSMKANTFYQEYHHQVTVISVYEDKRKQQYILDEGIRLIHLHVPFAKKTRNKAAGSLSKRLGLPEGTPMKTPVLEFCYKNDELGDPMVNEYHILAAGFATKEEIDTITEMAFKINEIMIEFFKQCKVDLIDFKIEFGRYKGKILLADEISPDTCRFWDMDTQEKLDKDRFRRDMGGVEEAYAEMMKRVGLA